MIPAGVSTVHDFLTYPRSYAYFAKQRIPFPHISASLPSGCRRRIFRSAFWERDRYSTPSPPMPNLRSQYSAANSAFISSGIATPLYSSMRMKSFPFPCSLVKCNSMPPISSVPCAALGLLTRACIVYGQALFQSFALPGPPGLHLDEVTRNTRRYPNPGHRG
ncbi:MAG: hypothetical protein A4E36_01250 [Methanoregulaceae archaeon PtaB.Bin009]|nr:MAG: hypothetical protein A4E36_01250 [Methanoregulaceae archaeon PtaB.Bin009]OPY41810.1 MAG: hypothetical protein A4E41_00710 [Methanoregulaceae archaeon PtaU1.Bin066]